MFNPEQLPKVQDPQLRRFLSIPLLAVVAARAAYQAGAENDLATQNLFRKTPSRRTLLKWGGTAALTLASAKVGAELFPFSSNHRAEAAETSGQRPAAQAHLVQGEQWLQLPNEPQQPAEWYPLDPGVAASLGMHTLYESGGPLDTCDYYSTAVGPQTNFRQHGQDLADWYFATYSNLSPIFRTTSGFCHGGANALACEEAAPTEGGAVSLSNKWGILFAKHSGDGMYKPGIDQLIEDLVASGRMFVIETSGPEGYWSRVVWGTNSRRTLVKATDFGRAPVILSIDEVQNAYYPVPQGLEGNYAPGTVKPAIEPASVLARWTFGISDQLRDYTVYG